ANGRRWRPTSTRSLTTPSSARGPWTSKCRLGIVARHGSFARATTWATLTTRLTTSTTAVRRPSRPRKNSRPGITWPRKARTRKATSSGSGRRRPKPRMSSLMIGFFKSLGAGMALLFDFSGALRLRSQRLRRRSFHDDAEAIHGDWERIGQTFNDQRKDRSQRKEIDHEDF